MAEAFRLESGGSRAERDSLPQASRRAGAAAPGNALGQRVFVGVALAVHAGGDAPGAQVLLKGVGGVLAAAITVMDQPCPRPLALCGALKSGDGQRGEDVFAAMAGDVAARAGIKGEGAVEPAFLSFNICDIALPNLTRTILGR